MRVDTRAMTVEVNGLIVGGKCFEKPSFCALDIREIFRLLD